ncbi:MAG: hypothetical protein HN790_03145 [Methylococcales bacterium]|nr:hypothetical protein [Methylococcales bacterium]
MNRGGSWNNKPRNVRSANRNRNSRDNRKNNLGFRLISTISPPEVRYLRMRIESKGLSHR